MLVRLGFPGKANDLRVDFMCKEIKKISGDDPVLVYAATVADAEEFAACLGPGACDVTHKHSDVQRIQKLTKYSLGEYKYLINCRLMKNNQYAHFLGPTFMRWKRCRRVNFLK